MIKTSVIAQVCEFILKLIIRIRETNSFRKLMLYPAELRGHSNPFIFYPIPAVTAFLPIYPAMASYIPTNPVTESGKTPENLNIYLLPFKHPGGIYG